LLTSLDFVLDIIVVQVEKVIDRFSDVKDNYRIFLKDLNAW